MKKATGKVIRAFRKHLGYTQEFVADKLNITITTLANIENGRVGLDIEKLYYLSRVFAIPIRIVLDLIIEIFEKNSEDGLLNAIKELKGLSFQNLEPNEN